MEQLTGKKLLIIGGAFQHIKVVEAAKSLGIITYVADYLEVKKSPAKQIADFAYNINIFDIDALVDLCRKERIDGVLATNLDICQKPYQQVCERLGFPCFGTKEQFRILTDKPIFKAVCRKYGLDVIPNYTLDDVHTKKDIQYPLFVKPTEASSSQGQSICNTKNEVDDAVAFARKFSRSGEILIEKYMGHNDDFSISGLMINGELYITRTSDRFLGTGKMDKTEISGVSPSRNSGVYWENVHNRLENMLRGIGLVNAPVFFQGFIDGGTIRFYDPGLRFPGAECEKAYERMYGINLTTALVHFAFTGKIPKEYKAIAKNQITGNGYSILLYLPIRPGTIAQVEGEKEVLNHPNVVAFCRQYSCGDTVGEYYTASQRYGEIDAVCKNGQEMKNMVNWIYDTLSIKDSNGKDMLFSKFDCERLNCYL